VKKRIVRMVRRRSRRRRPRMSPTFASVLRFERKGGEEGGGKFVELGLRDALVDRKEDEELLGDGREEV